MQLLHLRGRKICDRVLRKGFVWKGRTMVVRWLPGPPPHPLVDRSLPALYAGTLTSAKLDKSAVRRNRMRRRCREALRIALKNGIETPTAQLLLCPRSASLSAPFESLQDDIRAFLSTLSRHG